jgi:6-phosphogluconolactonase (cycloisomerase 2 family)
MSPPPLLTGTLLNDRYVVKHGTSRRVYVVRDRQEAGARRVVKEIIMGGLDAGDAERRRARLLEALEAIRTFRHPRLAAVTDAFMEGSRAYVVMDYVDGVSLEAILEMGAHGVREASVARWGAQIADALAWLHSRNPPFIFDDLAPEHVMVTPGDDIVLVDYGLRRFFGADAPPSCRPASAADLLRDQRALGRLLLHLLGEEGAASASRRALGVAAGLLDGAWPNLAEARGALETIEHDLEPVPTELALSTAPDPRPFLRTLLVIGAIALTAALSLSWSVTRANRPPPARIWLVEGDERVVAHTLDGSQAGPGHAVTGAHLGGLRWVPRYDTLVAMDRKQPCIWLIRGGKGSRGAPQACPVDGIPRALMVDSEQRFAYCVEDGHQLSEIAIVNGRVTRRWSLGSGARSPRPARGIPDWGMAESVDGSWLYVSETQASAVHAISLHAPGAPVVTTYVPDGPGPLLADPSGRFLWTALQDSGRLALLWLRDDGRINRLPQRLDALDDTVADLRFTPDRRAVYALCRDHHRIVAFDAGSHRLLHPINLVAWQPRAWAFSSDPPAVYVISEGATSIEVVDARADRWMRTVPFTGHPLGIEVEP